MTVEVVLPIVLLIDEDPQRRERLEMSLSTEEVTALIATSGEHGVELLSALGSACLIILSLTLPSRGAFVFLSRVRQLPLAREIRHRVALFGPRRDVEAVPTDDLVHVRLAVPFALSDALSLVRSHCESTDEAQAGELQSG